jgi:soluble lytic murein transglycosylase-like protein
MVCFDEVCPKRKFLKKSIIWAFALTLGLLVSISDVKLPAETFVSAERSGHPISEDIASFEDGFADHAEPGVSDLSASVYVPKGEPELLPYDRVIHEAAGRHDVDAELILAIIMAESQLNPRAKSKRGARGLMQLMPLTADALDVANIYNPEENINAGTRHFRGLLDRFDGNVKLALAAYNAGEQNVMRFNGIPPYPETQAYVARVLYYYTALKQDIIDF